MAYINKQQITQILNDAPAGVDKVKLLKELEARGNEIEGLTKPKNVSHLPSNSGAPAVEPGKSVGGFAGNVIKSGADFVKNTANAIIHPIDTAKSLGKVALGGVEKVVPGRQGAENEFDAVTSFFKERYGSLDAIKETAYNDPVGFASDLASILTGGGAAVAKVGKVAQVSKAASAGKALNRAADFVNPMTAATEGLKKIVPTQKLSGMAQDLYQSALKPSTTLSAEQRAEVLLNGLREGIPISKAGLEQLDNTIDSLNGEIASKIKAAGAAGETIMKSDVVSYLDEIREFSKSTLNPKALLKDIDALEDGFMKRASDGAWVDEIPIAEAQQIKQNTYRLLRKSYGEMKGIEVEAQKALTRGIKEQIYKTLETEYPELRGLNLRESKLLDLEKQLERATGRITNKDIIGLGEETAAIAGGVVAGTPGLLVGLAKKMMDSPEIKSKIGILLQKIADKKPTRPGKIRRVILPSGRLIQDAEVSEQ